MSDLDPSIREAINEALAQRATLHSVGAEDGEQGQHIFRGVDVIFYSVGNEYEVDILTPTGAVGFDIPIRSVGIKKKETA